MKRQIIAFLSLFGLVVCLSVAYVLIPSPKQNNEDKSSIVNAKIEDATSLYYEMMSLERESYYLSIKNEHTNILISQESTIEEKANALKKIEELNKIQNLQKGLQNALKTINFPHSFVQINDNEVNIIVENKNPSKKDAAIIFTEATTYLEDENLEIVVEFHS